MASYYKRVSLRLKPAGEAPVDRVVEPTTTGNPGALPGATRMRQRVATVTLTGWDPATKTVSFTLPNGRPTREHCRTPPTPRSSRVSRWAIA
jgi:hypothetical protein